MKRLVKILLAAAIIFNFQLSTFNLLQAQITCKEVNHESCKPGNDGAAKVTIPAKLKPYCTVEWTGPDGKKRTGEQISGLKAGAYSVVVKATTCNKVIYQDIVLVQKDADCRIYAGISVTSNSVPCNVQPTATLTASAWGGTPPYKYTWKTKTVSGSGTYGVTVTDSNGFVGSAKVSVSLKMTKCPEDPNEIDGPVGYGEEHLVSAEEKMRYTILYENSPEFASAPASLVNIVYPIPPEQNINSVRLSDFGFGSFVFNVPSNTTAYTQRLDVSDSLGVWVDVTAGIDMAKKQVFWNLQSVDPATGFEPASADLGFLLVNDSLHHGEGYVSFSIAPKGDVTSGDTVAAEATIVFNENTAIATNVWTNKFDAIAPTSTLHAEINDELGMMNDELDDSTSNVQQAAFTFSAHDDLSGIDNVELLVSLNGDAYQSLGYFALTDTAHYTLEEGYVYRFISRATDNVGNQEPMKSLPDTLINNNTAPVDILLSNSSFEENVATGTLVGTLTSIDNDITKPFVYELVYGEGDDDNGSFYIEGNGLYTGASYACSGRFDYSVRIRTTDITGLSFEKDFELKSIQQNYPYERSSNESICQGSAYAFGNRLLTATGSYTDSLTTERGCDSVVTVNLTVHPTSHTTSEASSCEYESFTWSGHNQTHDSLEAGRHYLYDTLYTTMGCDSTFMLALTVYANSSSTTTQDVCDSLLWNGEWRVESGEYTHTLANSAGCDSITTLHLTLRHSSTGVDVQTACDSYTWHGMTYTGGGTNVATYTTTNTVGCDSVATLNLTLHYSSTGSVVQTACDSLLWNGEWRVESGEYTHTLTNSVGCDSIASLHLTVNYSNTGSETHDVCDSYIWHDTTFTASGTHTHQTTNAAGCDSVATLYLTIRHSSTSSESQDVCDSYTWHGTTYTASGAIDYPTTNAVGCDSVATLYLTVRHSSSYVETVTVCDSFYWNGTTYTSSTSTPSFTGINAEGCDSVATLNLTINYSSAGNEIKDVCDSYTWNDTTYTASGTHIYQTTNTTGCDSVTTLNLTIRYSSAGNETQDVCDSYTWNDSTYTASGTHTYLTTNAANCDSVATLYLTVRHSSSYVETVTVCDSFYWNGTTYTNSTSIPSHTSINAAGCDSVVTLNLTINYSNTAIETVTACDSFDWYGTTYTSSTSSPSHTSTNAAGCDSVTTLNLTIRFSNTGNETVTACDSYDWYGTTYTSSTNTPTHTSMNVAGCDSVVTLHLTVNYSNTGDTTAISCDSYDWYGTTYTSSTSTPTHTSMNAVGCDSVVTLHLTINHSVTVYDSLSLSSTEIPYDYHGNTINVAGDYTFEGTTTQGCDSTTLLHVEVTTVGLDVVDPLAGIKVYPNPTHGTLTIDAEDVLLIEVYDLAGRKVTAFERMNSIEITDLATGTYTLRIKTARGETLRRIVKK